MASRCRFAKLVVTLIAATSLLYQLADALVEVKADRSFLDEICSQTEEYDFCMSTFEHDPRTVVADRDGLALLSVAINIDVVQATLDRIPDILKSTTDPVDKQRLEICQYYYQVALEKLRGAYKSSSDRSYKDVMNFVKDAVEEVIDCDGLYLKHPPIRRSPINDEAQKVTMLADITFIIIDPFLSTV